MALNTILPILCGVIFLAYQLEINLQEWVHCLYIYSFYKIKKKGSDCNILFRYVRDLIFQAVNYFEYEVDINATVHRVANSEKHLEYCHIVYSKYKGEVIKEYHVP